MVLLIGEALALDHTHFRWHDSGDIQSVDHLLRIFAVASRTPKVHHWLPTREQNLVAEATTKAPIPPNLNIRISDTHVDTPLLASRPKSPNLTYSGVHVKNPTGHICPASTQQNKCGQCRACWDPSTHYVSYPKH